VSFYDRAVNSNFSAIG